MGGILFLVNANVVYFIFLGQRQFVQISAGGAQSQVQDEK